MEKIEWTEKFSVGVSLFDNQHRQIIEMINKLIRTHRLSVDSDVISDTLTSMTEYARNHFKDEERFMTEHGYPDYDSHKERHKEFLKKTVSFCNATTLHVETVPEKLLEYLRNWWIHHILEQDMKYRQFFNEKGVR